MEDHEPSASSVTSGVYLESDKAAPPEKEKAPTVAAEPEKRAVRATKTLVYLALGAAALAVSATIFYLTYQEEQDDFEAEVCVVLSVCV